MPYPLLCIERSVVGFSLCSHLLAPADVACDGDDDIEAIEGGFEGNVFVEVEGTGHHIDGYPDEPLLQILMGQCPDAYDAEGCGKAVG